MIRRMVITRGHEWLRDGWQTRSFAAAGPQLKSNLGVRAMHFDEKYHPVRVPGQAAYRLAPAASAGFDYRAFSDVNRHGAAYCVRVDFEDEDAIARLKRDRQTEVVGVYADPVIAPTPVYCGDPPVGSHRDVAEALSKAVLREAGLTGKQVRVAVVDNGINGDVIKVAGGWSPVRKKPGTFPSDHGTMCAFDVRIMAPQASILDYALLQTKKGDTWTGFLSDAVAAFADLIALLQRAPGPLVVNNSWALFDRSEDAPIGSPENYSANPDHPFNQIVGTLVDAGADVLFAAGNCGAECPDGRCGAHDTGPGQSIHGANSHPDVITVAGVTVKRERVGYSSQGPGGLHKRKPDVAGYTHFLGSKVFGAREADSGTSAASPVVAGLVAALRTKADPQTVPPASLKALLQRTCKDLGGRGWDGDFGYGVTDALAAAKALKLIGRAKPASKSRKTRK